MALHDKAKLIFTLCIVRPLFCTLKVGHLEKDKLTPCSIEICPFSLRLIIYEHEEVVLCYFVCNN